MFNYIQILANIIRCVTLWFKLGRLEVNNSYRRTLLGPFWYTLNIIIFSFAMTFVYGALFGIPTFEYASYVITGMIAWQWFSSIVNDGGAAFINQKHLLHEPEISITTILWASSFRFALVYLHQLALVAALFLFGVVELNWYVLLIIPSFLLFMLMSVPFMGLLSMLFTRYRDVQKLFNASMIIILMLTPIFWRPDLISGWRTSIVTFNPFHHMIEFLRQPMLGQPIPMPTLHFIIIFTVISWILFLALAKRYSSRVIFWI